MTLVVVWDDLSELINENGSFRARADKAHVPFQHVEELRKLVDPALSEESPDPSDPGISIRGGPNRPCFLLRVDFHRPELEQSERLALLSHPLLAIENGPPALQPEEDGGQGHDRKSDNDAGQCDQELGTPFRAMEKSGFSESLRENQPARPETSDRNLAGQHFVKGRCFLYPNASHFALQKLVQRELPSPVLEGHDHRIHLSILGKRGEIRVGSNHRGIDQPHAHHIRILTQKSHHLIALALLA